MASGIYVIICTPLRKVYVGQSSHVSGRISHHRYSLRNGVHSIKALQEDWDTYGESAFQFRLLEQEADKHRRLKLEAEWIHKLDACTAGYNTAESGNAKKRHSLATRLKQSKAAKERNAEPAYNKMISDRCRRQWQDPEFRELVEKGRPKVNPNKGKPMSEAQKQLLRESALARRSQMVEAAKKSVLTRGFKLKG